MREPSSRLTSTATPSVTCSWRTAAGLPPASPKVTFIPGIRWTALTTAHAMRWVKLTLPRPRLRWRCRLTIERFTSRSFAGIVRTEVAVGTPSDSSIRFAMTAAAPRSGVPASRSGSSGSGSSAGPGGEVSSRGR